MRIDLRKVLISDDDPSTRLVLRTLLSGWGYEPVVTENGSEALERLKGEDILLAVVDWTMPGLSGVDVCRVLRRKKSDKYVYILLLTSRSRDDLAEGLEAGADDFITKPFDESELRARLKVGERIVDLEGSLTRKVQELKQAMAEMRQLKEIMPICMYCRKIRNDEDYWERIEEFLRRNAGVSFTHSVCPSCMESVVKQQLAELKRLPDEPTPSSLNQTEMDDEN